MSFGWQDERLARRVGVGVLLVLALAIACFVFLPDGIAHGSPTRIRVLFRHSGGLREHAPLVVAGQPIGQIEAIAAVPHGAGGPLAGEVGVAVTIALEGGSAWKVPARAEIFVASRGPLSDKYLGVAPPAGDPGPAIHDGQELRGIDPPSLDNVLQRAWTNMMTYEEFVAAVRPELQALRAQINELRDQLSGIASDAGGAGGLRALVAQAQELATVARQTYETSLGGDAGLSQFRALVADARQALAQLRATIDVLGPDVAAVAANLGRVRGHLAQHDPIGGVEQLVAKARAVLDQIAPLVARLDEIGDRLARGEGSLGRLMTDPEFPEDARDLGKVIKRHPWRILERPPN